MKKIKYYFEYQGFKLFQIILLSNALKNSSDKGAFFGKICACIGLKKKVALTNIALAFPELSKLEKGELYKKAMSNLARNLAEVIYFTKHGIRKGDFSYEVLGLNYLQQAQNAQRPIIFFSGHISNWEILPWILKQSGIPFAPMFRRPNNPYMEQELLRFRKTILGDIPVFSKGTSGARAAFKHLLRKNHLGILGDQKTNNGISSLFFDKRAMTSEAAATLSKRAKGLIVTGVISRSIQENKIHYTLEVLPPIDPQEQSVQTITDDLNSLLENWIKKNPSEWLWIHRRWDKSLYSDSY